MIEKEPKEREPQPRHLRVGIMGPLAAGKSTLSASLGKRWGIEPIEEKYRDNPYLERFYREPEIFSFRCQSWFIERKTDQMSGSKSDGTEIFDPEYRMDYLYAYAQFRMHWMTAEEFATYEKLFGVLVEIRKVQSADLYVVATASEKALLGRIEDRVKSGNRPFEKWILENFPSYPKILRDTVSEWVKIRQPKAPLLEIDTSDRANFAEGNNWDNVLGQIDGFVASTLAAVSPGKTREAIIAPRFPSPPRVIDKPPGIKTDGMIFY